MILVKSIKPQCFKDKEFQETIRRAFARVGATLASDFQKTTATWEHPVKFVVETHDFALTECLAAGGGLVEFDIGATARSSKESPCAEVYTEDDIWHYVNSGTPPHEIWAGYYTGKSEHKTLAFPSAFSPKTTPRKIESRAGSSGGATVFAPFVQHPGTEAREFTKTIKEAREGWFKTQMQQAMREAVQASGHAMK